MANLLRNLYKPQKTSIKEIDGEEKTNEYVMNMKIRLKVEKRQGSKNFKVYFSFFPVLMKQFKVHEHEPRNEVLE